MGYKVSHNGFGSGEVVSIQGGYIEVDFSGQKKSFQFPKAFEVFLKTDDSELLGKIEEEKKRLPKKVDPPKETFSSGRSSVSYALKHNHDVQIERNINNPLVGDRAQTISVRSEAEMFEIVGYMAKPGRIGSFEAEIPTDGRDKTFERLFPGQTYRPIEMGDTPSGLPNKMGPQFRINFLDLRNCPEILKKNMGKGVGSCVGRINKSKFVVDLVQNYGFRFGHNQDVDAIRANAQKKGYLEAFEEGYSR